MLSPDELKMVRARKVVDHGTGPHAIPLAQLTESILLNESLNNLTKAVEAIELPEPQEIEIPEYPTELAISNLPEIQRVEIVNPPKDKDDKEQLKLLKQIAEELKKKEQYAYDIEVDSDLKSQLKGEQGQPGKDGVEITPEQVRDKLSGLEGEERLDASAIKNLDSYVKETSSYKGWTRGVKTVTGGTGVTVDNTDPYNPILSASSGSGVDSFGIVVDGAGTAITTGSKGVRYIPFDCTVTGWDIRSDISGSCVFDVKRSGTSLAGTEKPTLTASTSNQDLALSTWTTSLLTGDVVEFVVDSASTLTRATLTILVTKV